MPLRNRLFLLGAALLCAGALAACGATATPAVVTPTVPSLMLTLAAGLPTGSPAITPAADPAATQPALDFAASPTAALPEALLATSTAFPTNTLIAVLPGGATRTPTPSAVCSDAPETRLAIGMTAHVIPQPPIPNNVRDAPSLSGKQIGLLQPGETMKILDGPKCGSGLVFWYVESLETGLKGWTAEGDEDGYWLAEGEG